MSTYTRKKCVNIAYNNMTFNIGFFGTFLEKKIHRPCVTYGKSKNHSTYLNQVLCDAMRSVHGRRKEKSEIPIADRCTAQLVGGIQRILQHSSTSQLLDVLSSNHRSSREVISSLHSTRQPHKTRAEVLTHHGITSTRQQQEFSSTTTSV